jgi:predicted Zn-dependent protease
MKTPSYLIILSILLASFGLHSCSKVPVTGRKQVSLLPASQMFAMSYQQYDEFLKEHPLSTDAQKTALVKNVGHRIQKAVEDYLAEKGMSQQLEGYAWEFNLVEDEQMNAWCMPGGKVVVYTGLLPVTRDEAGLAVVMGHEIAHAVADHGNERVSQMLLTQLGGVALSVALKDKPEQTQAIWMTAFGVGSQLGVLMPYSRLHESEADHLGLIFMAMAGYDPHEAIRFWERMSDVKQGQAPPEFLSTHPSDNRRIRDITRLIPEAMQYYKPR